MDTEGMAVRRWRQRSEGHNYKPSSICSPQRLKEREAFSPRTSGGAKALPTPSCCSSVSRTARECASAVLSQPECGDLFRQPRESTMASTRHLGLLLGSGGSQPQESPADLETPSQALSTLSLNPKNEEVYMALYPIFLPRNRAGAPLRQTQILCLHA